MDLQLKGKRALVTGSSSGIGEGISRALAREGVAVVLHGRNETALKQIAFDINNSGGQAAIAVGDLMEDSGARKVADEAHAAFSGIDILVNSAGGGDITTPWMETSPIKWAEILNQNVISTVRMVQHLAPEMRERGWGRIIQIASISGTQPLALGPDYGAAKAAVINLSVSLSKELAGTNISVNTVSPGPILTPALSQFFRSIAKEKGWGDDWNTIERMATREIVPNTVGRVGRVEEVANLVTFLTSPLAGYINGANLRIDGGYVSSIN